MTTCPEIPEIPADKLPDIPTGVNTDTVTEGCVTGNGIYDVFMRAHMDAIHQEYTRQRIKGSEYSKVYLGGMQQAMQSAVAFALAKDKAAAEAELSRYAILKSQADIALIQQQICLVQAQIEEMNNKAKLAEIQGWVELSKIHDNPSLAAAATVAELRTAGKSQVTDIEPGSVFGAQITKSTAETALLGQKKVTEVAQTVDPTGGILGKQAKLYQRQADGFLRDAEQKLSKIVGDAFAVQYSVADSLPTVPEDFDKKGIDHIVGIAVAGIENPD